MKKIATYSLIAGSILLACMTIGVIALRSAIFSAWEGGLRGPYEGKIFSEKITSRPRSSLDLKSVGTLEIHQDIAQQNPVLALRRDGQILWTRLMAPSDTRDGQIETAGVRDALLVSQKKSSDGIKVLFTCDWDWGGQEGGLIYLSQEGNFERFAISWKSRESGMPNAREWFKDPECPPPPPTFSTARFCRASSG